MPSTYICPHCGFSLQSVGRRNQPPGSRNQWLHRPYNPNCNNTTDFKARPLGYASPQPPAKQYKLGIKLI